MVAESGSVPALAVAHNVCRPIQIFHLNVFVALLFYPFVALRVWFRGG